MWPEISQLTAGCVAESSTRQDHERRNHGHRNLSSCVEWWAGDDQHRMTLTCSTLWDTAAPDRGDTCTLLWQSEGKGKGRFVQRFVMSYSSLKHSGMARVNEGSQLPPHVYPQVEWAIPAFTPQPQSITTLWLVFICCSTAERRLSWHGQIGEILR